MYSLKKFLDGLEHYELVRLKQQIEKGNLDIEKEIRESIMEHEKKHGKFCATCSNTMDPYNTSNYTIVFGPDDFRKKLFDSFTNVKEQIQTRLAEIERDVIYIKKALIENIEEYLNIKHKQVTNLSSELENLFKNTEGNDKLLSLNLIKAKQNIDTSIKELEDKESDLSKHAKNVRSVALYMLSKIPQFKKPIDDMFKTVRCWNDQTILKVPTGKTKVKIKCPKCGYQFVVNSNPTLKKANFLLNLFSKKDKALQGDIVRKN